ncbi:hypothetical protein AVEN_111724-1 [Araneus ventricosus]|uniref:Uncharacterized protein n=1 Tax=Araneus ventricosus TaxID=182803 RepID=A0A4Y2C811_ARAVE|nr:hypothetical protein AVEN_111724-1 [Araneus ventricosus]
MTMTTSELKAPLRTTPMGGRSITTYDLTCRRPHIRRIFSGLGFRTWNPPVPKPSPHHLASVASFSDSEWPETSRSKFLMITILTLCILQLSEKTTGKMHCTEKQVIFCINTKSIVELTVQRYEFLTC